MAVLGGSSSNPTLLDVIKRTAPDGMIADIVEAMNQRNPVIKDMTFMEGNLPTGHRHSIRQGLPTVGWRRLNDGIDSSKSQVIQVDEACGLLEGRSEIDCEVARLNGNEGAFRMSEDAAFMEAMEQEFMSALFYASTKTDEEKIHGFSPRFSDLSAGNGGHIVNMEDADLGNYTAAGSNIMSMWFITWSPRTCFGIYPKGMKGGLDKEDLGKDYVTGANGKQMLAWRTHFIWRLGLSIRDWRHVVRIANIDTDEELGTETGLIKAMVKAYNRLYDRNAGRTVIYCNRTVLTLLDLQIINKANNWFRPTEWHGEQVTGFRGIPIVPCDGLLTSESRVT